jgi:hypothetical protein
LEALSEVGSFRLCLTDSADSEPNKSMHNSDVEDFDMIDDGGNSSSNNNAADAAAAAVALPTAVVIEDQADDEVFVSPVQVARPKDQHQQQRPNNDAVLNTPVYTPQTPIWCPDLGVCPPGRCKGNAKITTDQQDCKNRNNHPELTTSLNYNTIPINDELTNNTMTNAAQTMIEPSFTPHSSISPTRATPFHTPPPSVTFSSSSTATPEHAQTMIDPSMTPVDVDMLLEEATKQPLQPPDLFKDHHDDPFEQQLPTHEEVPSIDSISPSLSFSPTTTTTDHPSETSKTSTSKPSERAAAAPTTAAAKKYYPSSSSLVGKKGIKCTKANDVMVSIKDKSDDISDSSSWSEEEGDKSDWSENAWSDEDDVTVIEDPPDDNNSRPFSRLFKEARRAHQPEHKQVMADLYRMDMENDDDQL